MKSNPISDTIYDRYVYAFYFLSICIYIQQSPLNVVIIVIVKAPTDASMRESQETVQHVMQRNCISLITASLFTLFTHCPGRIKSLLMQTERLSAAALH